jgi:putative ABC transport system substrate-binding protein
VRRRDFFALLGGVAAPVAMSRPARAQQSTIPIIGYLQSRSAADAPHLADAFGRGLREEGFVDGQNVRIEFRWADGDFKRLPALVQELTGIPVAVLAATGGVPSAAAAKAAAATVPVIFAMSGDPIKMGLATSFNRPGRNATGVQVLTTSLEPKRLGLLHELVPQATTVGVLIDQNHPSIEWQLQDLQQAAPQAGVKLRELRVSADRDIDTAFETMAKERIGALTVAGSPYLDTRRAKIIVLAEHYRVPAIYHFREYPFSGGLMSYGIDIREVHRQVGRYAGQILKGAKAGDLPIVLPTKFELVINLKTAKAIGLTIPPTLLARADEAIE